VCLPAVLNIFAGVAVVLSCFGQQPGKVGVSWRHVASCGTRGSGCCGF